jgi:transcriptional regulator of met regulon
VIRNDGKTVNPLAKHGVYSEGNMKKISKTIPINISGTLDVVENVFVRA